MTDEQQEYDEAKVRHQQRACHKMICERLGLDLETDMTVCVLELFAAFDMETARREAAENRRDNLISQLQALGVQNP